MTFLVKLEMKNKTQEHFFLFKRSRKLSLADQENGEEGKNRDKKKKKWEQVSQRPLYTQIFILCTFWNTPKDFTLPSRTLSQMLIPFFSLNF